MEKVEILKIDCKPRKVHLYRVDFNAERSCFMVFEGRKRAEWPYFFENYYEALRRCMLVALGNSAYYKMTGGIS